MGTKEFKKRKIISIPNIRVHGRNAKLKDKENDKTRLSEFCLALCTCACMHLCACIHIFLNFYQILSLIQREYDSMDVNEPNFKTETDTFKKKFLRTGISVLLMNGVLIKKASK